MKLLQKFKEEIDVACIEYVERQYLFFDSRGKNT